MDAKDPLFLDKFEMCKSQPLTFKQGGQKGQGTNTSHLLESRFQSSVVDGATDTDKEA